MELYDVLHYYFVSFLISMLHIILENKLTDDSTFQTCIIFFLNFEKKNLHFHSQPDNEHAGSIINKSLIPVTTPAHHGRNSRNNAYNNELSTI